MPTRPSTRTLEASSNQRSHCGFDAFGNQRIGVQYRRVVFDRQSAGDGRHLRAANAMEAARIGLAAIAVRGADLELRVLDMQPPPGGGGEREPPSLPCLVLKNSRITASNYDKLV